MLVFKRALSEAAIIDLREFGLGLIKVVTVHRHHHTKIGFEADKRIPIHREEVFQAIERSKQEPEAVG